MSCLRLLGFGPPTFAISQLSVAATLDAFSQACLMCSTKLSLLSSHSPKYFTDTFVSIVTSVIFTGTMVLILFRVSNTISDFWVARCRLCSLSQLLQKNYWLYRKKLNENFVDIKKIYQTLFTDLNLVNLFICKSQKNRLKRPFFQLFITLLKMSLGAW